MRSSTDLESIKSTAVAARRTGTSTEHDQSSRSHALFKLEVATEAIVSARNELERHRALLPAIKNAHDNNKGRFWHDLVDSDSTEPKSTGAQGEGGTAAVPLEEYSWLLKKFDTPDGWYAVWAWVYGRACMGAHVREHVIP